MKQRIQTAIVALIIFVPFVLYGNLPFIIFTYFLATIGLNELLKMNKNLNSPVITIITIGFLWMLLFFGNTMPITFFSKSEIIILFVLVLLAYTVLSKNKFTFDDASFLLLATIYIGMGFYFLIQIRMDGLNYILYALFVIWGTDTGAYLFGRTFGKRKLWPDISPNKTIEGALGGLIIALIVGAIFQIIYPFDFSMMTVLIVSVFVSIVGQIGDLVASAFKRHYHVKDSGNLLPGHGGILDRMDSLLFVLPFLHLIHFVS